MNFTAKRGADTEVPATQCRGHAAAGLVCLHHDRQQRCRFAPSRELGGKQVDVGTRRSKNDIETAKAGEAIQIDEFHTNTIKFASIGRGRGFDPSGTQQAETQPLGGGKSFRGYDRGGRGTVRQNRGFRDGRATVAVQSMRGIARDADVAAHC